MTQYGIFDDQAADYSDDQALEAQMYSREAAEARLREMAEEYGEHAHVHVVDEEYDDEVDKRYDDAHMAMADIEPGWDD